MLWLFRVDYGVRRRIKSRLDYHMAASDNEMQNGVNKIQTKDLTRRSCKSHDTPRQKEYMSRTMACNTKLCVKKDITARVPCTGNAYHRTRKNRVAAVRRFQWIPDDNALVRYKNNEPASLLFEFTCVTHERSWTWQLRVCAEQSKSRVELTNKE